MKDFSNKLNRFIDNGLNKGGRRRLWLMLVLITILAIACTALDAALFTLNIPETVSTGEFIKDLEAGNIDTIYYSSTEETMRYTLFNDVTREMTPEQRAQYVYDKTDWRQTAYLGGDTFRQDMLVTYGVNLKIKVFAPVLSEFWSLIFSFVLIIIMIGCVVFVMQSDTFTGKKFDLTQGQIDTTFKDVIGQDEVLDDLKFIVRMMKGEKLDTFGATIPKGVLLSGPPGTGKTLIARAVAGEAGVPFFSANASEFIDTYVGVGAKTVRTLFKQARKHKPCVIFIDEIDAVASVRGAQGTTSEDNKTVNALLQEMDGFNKDNGVFIIAATNNPNSLDPAITRAGRFDRQVTVQPPRDWKVRRDMFKLYIGDAKNNVDIDALAKQTVGFTGADISVIVNEAKLVAAMSGKEMLDAECFEIAIDKKIFKANRCSTKAHQHDIETTAYHEAGHAVMNYLAKRPIARASIIGSTSGVGGVVFSAEKDTTQFMTQSEYEWQIRICYAGRAAEIIKFGEMSDGATNDISQATKLIYLYACRVGMSDDFGLLDVDTIRNYTPFAVPVDTMRTLSKQFAQSADMYMQNNFELVEAIAKELMDKETLSGNEIQAIIDSIRKT